MTKLILAITAVLRYLRGPLRQRKRDGEPSSCLWCAVVTACIGFGAGYGLTNADLDVGPLVEITNQIFEDAKDPKE